MPPLSIQELAKLRLEIAPDAEDFDINCQLRFSAGEVCVSGREYTVGITEARLQLSLEGCETVIRDELGVSATDNQGQVIQAAHERAREYLRKGTDFVWNATNVTRLNRSKVLRLLRDYPIGVSEIPMPKCTASGWMTKGSCNRKGIPYVLRTSFARLLAWLRAIPAFRFKTRS